jgi:hypothetical protein
LRISKLEILIRILVATDAWQINGVVRTLTSLARSAAALGADIGRNLLAQAALNARGFKRLGT